MYASVCVNGIYIFPFSVYALCDVWNECSAEEIGDIDDLTQSWVVEFLFETFQTEHFCATEQRMNCYIHMHDTVNECEFGLGNDLDCK